ncbi:MAG TPA: hypothetical protein PKE62_17550 [Anaerolineales bacterium]|nr:hypothetical protein [Anaerolineales bacterium]
MKNFRVLPICLLTAYSIVLLALMASCSDKNYEQTATPYVSTVYPTIVQSAPSTIDSMVAGDGGLLSKEPCGPPCLMGITPGITSRDAVLTVLKEKINLINCREWDKRNEGGTYGVSCGSLGITFQDSDIVNWISFKPSSQITVEDMIKVYGEPSGLFVVEEDDGMGNVISVRMILYYDAIKTRLDLAEQSESIYLIALDTRVENISYVDHAEYEKSTEGYNPWNGFGEYLISTFPGDSK